VNLISGKMSFTSDFITAGMVVVYSIISHTVITHYNGFWHVIGST